MEVMWGYGLGANLQQLLKKYRDGQTLISRARGYYSRGKRGVTLGDPVSPTIFKIVVDAVLRAAFMGVCVPHEDHHGVGWVAGGQYILFYSDDGRIVGRNLD